MTEYVEEKIAKFREKAKNEPEKALKELENKAAFMHFPESLAILREADKEFPGIQDNVMPYIKKLKNISRERNVLTAAHNELSSAEYNRRLNILANRQGDIEAQIQAEIRKFTPGYVLPDKVEGRFYPFDGQLEQHEGNWLLNDNAQKRSERTLFDYSSYTDDPEKRYYFP